MSKQSTPNAPIELQDIPTVVATEEGFRFATQVVPELPGGVDVCVQVRENAPIDLADHMHMMRSAALLGYFTSSRCEFDRKYPVGSASLDRMRIPVRAYIEIGESPEEDILREQEERRQAERRAQKERLRKEREEEEERNRATMRTIARPIIRPLEEERDELRRQLEEERAARAAAEAKLAGAAAPADVAPPPEKAERETEAANEGAPSSADETGDTPRRTRARHRDQGSGEPPAAA